MKSVGQLLRTKWTNEVTCEGWAYTSHPSRKWLLFLTMAQTYCRHIFLFNSLEKKFNLSFSRYFFSKNIFFPQYTNFKNKNIYIFFLNCKYFVNIFRLYFYLRKTKSKIKYWQFFFSEVEFFSLLQHSSLKRKIHINDFRLIILFYTN